jgi:hypothetical protein
LDPDNDEKPLRISQSYIEYGIFSLFKINVINLIQIKTSLAKNFHIQPSEIDHMPMWEYELFITELNKQVKDENKQQQEEMDKYHINDYMKNSKNMPKMTQPKMPSFKMDFDQLIGDG